MPARNVHWMTPNYLKKAKERDHLYKCYKANPTIKTWNNYKITCNAVNNLRLALKKKWTMKKLTNQSLIKGNYMECS